MKTSRPNTGMFSSEKDDFKFLKKCEKHKKHVRQVHDGSRARGTVLSLQTSLSLVRNLNVKVAIELHNIFSKIDR